MNHLTQWELFAKSVSGNATRDEEDELKLLLETNSGVVQAYRDATTLFGKSAKHVQKKLDEIGKRIKEG